MTPPKTLDDEALRATTDGSVGLNLADDQPGPPYTVTVVRDAASLAAHTTAWERLVQTALEGNPYHAPMVLQPAMELLAPQGRVAVALVYGTRRKHPEGAAPLCGLFPLESRGRGPWRHLRSWSHPYCVFNTPLVRRDCAAEVFTTLFDWLATSDDGAALMQFRYIAAAGPVHEELVATLRRRQLRNWVTDRYYRALFVRAADAETYLQYSLDRKHRHEARRLRRRLAETGKLESTGLVAAEELDGWIDEFLRLEAVGWKGQHGTAMACFEADREFLRRLLHGAFRRGQLSLVGLKLDGRHVALGCNLLDRDGGFAFKIAFDERLAKYSPGVLLMLEQVEAFHRLPGLRWLDSCADPEHPMIDRLWRDRRPIEHLWIASGRRGGDFLLAAAPVAKWLRDTLRRSRRGAVPLEKGSDK